MKYKLQDKLDELLTLEKVAKETNIPLRTLRYWIKVGRLPVYHMPDYAKYGIRLIDIPKYLRQPKLKINK
jgi:DNA-binding transcriptional MerR regulator